MASANNRKKEYDVCILTCNDSKCYINLTDDLREQIKKHEWSSNTFPISSKAKFSDIKCHIDKSIIGLVAVCQHNERQVVAVFNEMSECSELMLCSRSAVKSTVLKSRTHMHLKTADKIDKLIGDMAVILNSEYRYNYYDSDDLYDTEYNNMKCGGNTMYFSSAYENIVSVSRKEDQDVYVDVTTHQSSAAESGVFVLKSYLLPGRIDGEETTALLSSSTCSGKDLTEVISLQSVSSECAENGDLDHLELDIEIGSNLQTNVNASSNTATGDIHGNEDTEKGIQENINTELEEIKNETAEDHTAENEPDNVDTADVAEDGNTFRVIINSTKASERLGLYGTFKLTTSQKELELLDNNSDNVLHKWPYKFIRRFGCNNERNSFLIDAGRKCESGEGIFDFQIVGNLGDIIAALRDKDGCSLRRTNQAGINCNDG